MTWSIEWDHGWPEPTESSIERAWQRAWIHTPHSHVFQQPRLSRMWVDTVARPRGERSVLAIARDGRRTIYCPFTIRRRAGVIRLPELRSLGANLTFDYQDPLVDGPSLSAAEWGGFWRALEQSTRGLPVGGVEFSHVPAYACPDRFDGVQAPRFVASTVAPNIDLRGLSDIDALFARLTAKHRGEIRRKLHALADCAPSLRVWNGDNVADALAAFDNMRTVYAEQHRGGFDLFRDPQVCAFYHQMIVEGLPAGWVHLSALVVDDGPISWHFGFLWNKRFYWYKPCYAPASRHWTPGHLHIAFLLTHGILAGWEAFDFTVGDERYKRHWSSDAPPVYRVSWFTENWWGSAARALRDSAVLARRFTKFASPTAVAGAVSK
jgi:CelD/BcsL family acetyltransferase involved in cellulose biosynthesis